MSPKEEAAESEDKFLIESASESNNEIVLQEQEPSRYEEDDVDDEDDLVENSEQRFKVVCHNFGKCRFVTFYLFNCLIADLEQECKKRNLEIDLELREVALEYSNINNVTKVEE